MLNLNAMMIVYEKGFEKINNIIYFSLDGEKVGVCLNDLNKIKS